MGVVISNRSKPNDDERFNVSIDGQRFDISGSSKTGLYLPTYFINERANDILDKKDGTTVIQSGEEKSQEIIAGIIQKSAYSKEVNDVPQLEDKNFKINSDSWTTIEKRDGVKAKTNGEGVWEYLEGEFKGEQIFTQDVAKKYGRLPSIEQYGQIIQSINPKINLSKEWQDDNTTPSIKDILGIKLAGFRYLNGVFCDQGKFCFLWSSSPGYCVVFDETRVLPVGEDGPFCALSVRFLKN